MRYWLILGVFTVILWPHSVHAAIGNVSSGCTGTNNCSATNTTGDAQLAYACRDGSTTAPTTAAGWTSPAAWTKSINGTGSADSVCKLACRITTSNNQASGTFTNATAFQLVTYSGPQSGDTALCATNIFNVVAADFFATAINTTSTTETFNTKNTQNSESWVVGFGYAPAATAGMGTAPSGMTNRLSCGSCTSTTSGGVHDTNAGTSSFSTANVTITTASRIITVVVEIVGTGTNCGAQDETGAGRSTFSCKVNLASGAQLSVFCKASGTLGSWTISDTASNSFGSIQTSANNIAGIGSTAVWALLSATANSADEVTCNYGGSVTFVGIIVRQHTGYNNAVDVAATTTCSGTCSGTVTSNSFSTAVANEVIDYFAVHPSAGTWSVGAIGGTNGITLQNSGIGTTVAGSEERTISSTLSGATAAITTTAGSEGTSIGHVLSFKQTVAGGFTPRLTLLGVGD